MSRSDWCHHLWIRSPEGSVERMCFLDAMDLYTINQESKSEGTQAQRNRMKAKRLLDKGLKLRASRIKND